MDSNQRGGLFRRILGATATLLGIGYPLALALVVLALRFIGDSWWVTSVMLYLPRLGFAVPLPFVLLVVALAKKRRLLWLQLASVGLLLFPLLGLNLAFRTSPAAGEKSIRVLTYNVDSANAGFRAVLDEITVHAPDLVFLQELPPWRAEQMKAELLPTFPNLFARDQFMVASKFPIVSGETPPRLPFFGRDRSPRFMRFVVQTPFGPVTVYSLHTVSPRGGFYRLRGKGLRHELVSGHIFSGVAASEIVDTAALRGLQAKATAEMALAEPGPTLIVGDSNLPTLSGQRAHAFGDFQDGFAKAGLGFGYTYPAKYPWMRIDLLLASNKLAFKRVEVGRGRASDHLCVFGDVVLREP